MKKVTPEKLANKWIREMQKAKFTPDQMLECLKLAREKYEAIFYKTKRFKELHAIATAPKSELGGMITGNGFIEWLKKNQ